MGTPNFALPSLEILSKGPHQITAVVTQPDRPRGRGKERRMSPVKEWALERSIHILQPVTLKDQSFRAQLHMLNPDIIITAAYGKLLPPDLLKQPPLGCINLHASLLPAYRGAAPIHRAVMDGVDRTGVTVIYMEPEMDAGDIIMQEEMPLTLEDTAGTLHDRLASRGGRLLSRTIDALAKGTAAVKPQDPEKATFAPSLKPEDERLDWRKEALILYNHIRGMNPWPGAYTTWAGKRLKIWKARYPGERPAQPGEIGPGVILEAGREELTVAAADGPLQLLEVQPEGKKVMSGGDFFRGYCIKQGAGFI